MQVSNTFAHSYSYSYAHSDTYTYSDSYPDTHAYSYPDADSHTYTYSHTDPDGGSEPISHTDAFTFGFTKRRRWYRLHCWTSRRVRRFPIQRAAPEDEEKDRDHRLLHL